MAFPTAQDAVVTVVALGAAVILVRRVAAFSSSSASPKCANCESGACAPQAEAGATTPAPAEHPLVLVRAPRR